MAYKVYYSFLHDNQVPYETDYYKLYRQEVVNGASGTYIQIAQITPTGLGKDLIISGVDLVNDCNIEYNYKVSAYNDNAEIFCINPLFSGIEFTCPTPSPTVTPTATTTPTPSITPTITVSSSITPTITVSSSITPTMTVSPSITPTITATPTITPTITPTLTPTATITPTVPLVNIQFDGGTYTLCDPSNALVIWNGTHNIQEVSAVGYANYDSSEHIGTAIKDFEDDGHTEVVAGLGSTPGQTRYFVCTTHPTSKFSTTC